MVSGYMVIILFIRWSMLQKVSNGIHYSSLLIIEIGGFTITWIFWDGVYFLNPEH